MDRKKILWISHFLPFPVKSGAQMRSFNLIKQLAEYHDVYLICAVQEGVVKNYFPSLEEAIDKAEPVFNTFCKSTNFVPLKNVNKYRKLTDLIKSIFSFHSYANIRLKDKSLNIAIQNSVEFVQPDVIHLDTIASGIYLENFRDIDIVLNHHNIESEMMTRRAKKTSNIILKMICKWDSIKIRRMEKKLISEVKKHLVCSKLDKDRLQNIFPFADIAVIPNGIDCSLPVPDRTPTKGKLLFIGGLDWYPNADAMRFFLMEVWPPLTKQLPHLTLDIVGKLPPNDILALAAKYENVRIHGFVEDISTFYKEAWIYVCPIQDGGGTKLKVLDAMANRVMLVAHPIAMEGIDASENEHYIPASTIQDYINAISFINSMNPIQIAAIESSSRQLILDNYDYKKIGPNLSSAYS